MFRNEHIIIIIINIIIIITKNEFTDGSEFSVSLGGAEDVDHSQGILVRSGHQGQPDRMRGLEVCAVVQTTQSVHALASFAHPSLTFDLVTRHP